MTTFGAIPLNLISASRTNPRKHFDPARLAELADSIKSSGVHTPVLLRPLPAARLQDTFSSRSDGAPLPEYELVAGERRLRASALAGASTIPAMIRELTDEQTLEIQIIENLQRDDLTALEEAQGYQTLIDHSSITADQVAKKIGKSRSHVFGRMKLLDLGQDGQEALRLGLIDASKALLLARIPSTLLQAKALQEIVRPNHAEGVMSHRMAQDWIRSRYMLKIEQAPFDHTDGSMAPRACTACPSRTGASPDIFSDVQGADMCTEPDCYNNKLQQHHSRRRDQLEAKGHKVIDGADAKALMPHAFFGVEGYARLDDAADSPTNQPLRVELAKLLERGELKPVVIVNPHEEGDFMECVPDDQVEALLARAGKKKAAEAAKAERAQEEQADAIQLDRSTQHVVEKACRLRTLERVHAVLVEEAPLYMSGSDKLLRALRLDSLEMLDKAEEKHLVKILGLEGIDDRAALVDWTREPVGLDAWSALVLLVAARTGAPFVTGDDPFKPGEPFTETVMHYLGIDAAAINAEVHAEVIATCEAAKADLPLPPAAQAKGGRGAKAKDKAEASEPKVPARESPAAARGGKRRLSAEDAQLGIAAAMQDLEEESTGDCAGAKPGADAQGNEALTLASDTDALGQSQTGQVQGLEALANDKANQRGGHQEEGGDLYQRAVDLVMKENRASISLVQRHLQIGYSSAAKLLEAMEANGLISAMQPNGARTITRHPQGHQAAGIKLSDALLEDAADLVKAHQVCSVRYLKHELGIGTDRAMNIIEQLERDGVVSAPDATRNRKVLVTA